MWRQHVHSKRWYTPTILHDEVALSGLVVIVLAIRPKARGFKPARGRWIFKGDQNPQHDFLRTGSTAGGPMS
jgi:hypothetical protein